MVSAMRVENNGKTLLLPPCLTDMLAKPSLHLRVLRQSLALLARDFQSLIFKCGGVPEAVR
jgi:hypothetical protein